jgi:hypothetical protein
MIMEKYFENEERERLYTDTEGSRYIMWHTELTRAIYNKYKVSGLDICIFETIAMYYDSHKQKPYKGSFADLAKLCNCNRLNVGGSIHALLQWKLIIALDSDKTNTKLEYIPNVKQLRKILVAYISPKHTNAPKIKRCKEVTEAKPKRHTRKVTPPAPPITQEAVPSPESPTPAVPESPIAESQTNSIPSNERPHRQPRPERHARIQVEPESVEADSHVIQEVTKHQPTKEEIGRITELVKRYLKRMWYIEGFIKQYPEAVERIEGFKKQYPEDGGQIAGFIKQYPKEGRCIIRFIKQGMEAGGQIAGFIKQYPKERGRITELITQYTEAKNNGKNDSE